MKKFFKRFGVVFLAVMFLFCSFAVGVSAANIPDQIEDIMPITDGSDSDVISGIYYVPSGWTCETGTSYVDCVGLMCFYPTEYSLFVNCFMVGYEYVEDSEEMFIEKQDSIVVGLGTLAGVESYVTLTPDSDIFGIFMYSLDDPCVDFFENEAAIFAYSVGSIDESSSDWVIDEDLMYGTYSVPKGWTVNSGYYYDSVDCGSFYLNGKLYKDYFVAMGYAVSDGALVEAENSIVLYKDSLDESIQLTSDDTFTFRFVDCVPLLYVSLHNGSLMPPTLIESILDIFLSVGEWISGAVSALIPLFWDSSASALTFVGVLSVSGLAFSVSMLLISLISKFLRFGG